MPAFRPTLPSGSQGGPHPRARRRPHAAACAMCSGPGVQAQRCWDTDGAADGGGQQRAAGDSRGRRGTGGLGQGLWGETHHGSEELGTHVIPSQLAPATGGTRGRKWRHTLCRKGRSLDRRASRPGTALRGMGGGSILRVGKPARHTGEAGPWLGPCFLLWHLLKNRKGRAGHLACGPEVWE